MVSPPVTPENGEWAIVGGTGEFNMAYGTIVHTMIKHNVGTEALRKLDIHAFYTPKTAQTVHDTLITPKCTTGQAE
uniref:Dirigent protein n=1 Tax=Oryza sativa subsp. japonica TaxID=39947 RepID=Q339S6_ORYSJ|nr:hypothetical protein LOC_Os10g18800 [Oryza sativa Japonica Group]